MIAHVVAAEIVKAQVNEGRRRELYHFRDEQGLEVDFVVPGRDRRLSLVECKAGRTVTPAMATSLQRLGRAVAGAGGPARQFLVHQAPRAGVETTAVAPGVRALSWQRFLEDEAWR
jgi:predicted AAA+ superfamily ATPase